MKYVDFKIEESWVERKILWFFLALCIVLALIAGGITGGRY